jgi:VWFA-related protein
MRRSGFVALVVFMAAIAGAGQTPEQTAQTPTFQSQVTYVQVDAIVTDEEGRFVRDLTKEDFEILEDGQPQQIDAFSLVDIPVEAPAAVASAMPVVEPDVRSNAAAFEGRVYVLVLDAGHTEFAHTPQLKAVAREFVERHLGPRDLMAVVHSSGKQEAGQDFTDSKRLLLASIDRFEGQKLRSAALVKDEASAAVVRSPAGERLELFQDFDYDAERISEAVRMLRSLKEVADWFSGVRGRRKAIILLGEGIDYDVENVFGSSPVPGAATVPPKPGASAIFEEARRAIAAVTRANVSVYALDPAGLTPMAGGDIERFSEIVRGPDGSPATRDAAALNRDSMQNERRLARNNLRYITENTGGFALVNSSEFSPAFDRIVNENSSYYVLAYYPNAGQRENRFHSIQVRVKRPGASVRARRGYETWNGSDDKPARSPAAEGLSPELLDVLRSPIPVSGLTLRLFAAPFKTSKSNASVLLGMELSGRDLRLGENETVELSYAAIDNAPKVRASRTFNLKLNLQPETRARAERTGIRLLRRVELPPGRYQVRVAAREGVDGLAGSVVADLEVPDFTNEPLTMSGVVLTSPSGSLQPTLMPDDRLKGVLPAPPIGQRRFPQSDEIALFVEIYDNGTPLHVVDLTTTIAHRTGTVVFETRGERSSQELASDRTYRYSTALPLEGVPPGDYVLTITARSRLGPMASRRVAFTVVAAQ